MTAVAVEKVMDPYCWQFQSPYNGRWWWCSPEEAASKFLLRWNVRLG